MAGHREDHGFEGFVIGTTSRTMLPFLFWAASADNTTCQTNWSCLQCVGGGHCGFCFDNSSCLDKGSSTCQSWTASANKQCVEQLGGDAKGSVRYAIGFTVVAVGIAIDVTIRLIVCCKSGQDYANLETVNVSLCSHLER
jgi:hypothetical protein